MLAAAVSPMSMLSHCEKFLAPTAVGWTCSHSQCLDQISQLWHKHTTARNLFSCEALANHQDREPIGFGTQQGMIAWAKLGCWR